jgi:hypothetical protein
MFNSKNLQLKNAFNYTCCFVFAWLVTERFSGFGSLVAFVDIENYYQNFSQNYLSTDYLAEGLVSFLVNENLWSWTIKTLLYSGFSLPEIFYAITLVLIFIASCYLAKRHGLVSVLLLLNPIFIDFAASQLRMAFALSLFLSAIMFSSRILSAVLLVSAAFIHLGMVPVVTVYIFLSWALKTGLGERVNGYKKMLLIISLTIGTFITVGPFKQLILAALEDRRAFNEDQPGGLLFATFWAATFSILVFVFVQSRKIPVSVGFSIVWLGVYILSAFSGYYSARWLAAIFPFIVSTILFLASEKMKEQGVSLDLVQVRYLGLALIVAYVVNTSIQWGYWLISNSLV